MRNMLIMIIVAVLSFIMFVFLLKQDFVSCYVHTLFLIFSAALLMYTISLFVPLSWMEPTSVKECVVIEMTDWNEEKFYYFDKDAACYELIVKSDEKNVSEKTISKKLTKIVESNDENAKLIVFNYDYKGLWKKIFYANRPRYELRIPLSENATD